MPRALKWNGFSELFQSEYSEFKLRNFFYKSLPFAYMNDNGWQMSHFPFQDTALILIVTDPSLCAADFKSRAEIIAHCKKAACA